MNEHRQTWSVLQVFLEYLLGVMGSKKEFKTISDLEDSLTAPFISFTGDAVMAQKSQIVALLKLKCISACVYTVKKHSSIK